MHHVIAIIPTKDRVADKCLQALRQQTYPLQSILISVMEPRLTHNDPEKQRFLNIAANRNQARQMALGTQANYFLWIDSDVIIPHHALAEFMKQVGQRQTTITIPLLDGSVIPAGTEVPEKHILGGWYLARVSGYTCGHWIADNTFQNFTEVHPSLVETDMVGLGCALISREVLEKIEFEAGIELYTTDGRFLGDCAAFGNRAAELNYRMYMDGDVVCEHQVERIDY